jgi:hypothetical protein
VDVPLQITRSIPAATEGTGQITTLLVAVVVPHVFSALAAMGKVPAVE